MSPCISRGLAALLLVGCLLCAAGLRAQDSTIWQAKDDFVRLEPGAGPSAAPRLLPPLSPDAVHAVLASITLTGAGGSTPFLDDDQVALLSEPVARALKSAAPGQDVTFAAHYVSVMSVLGPPKTTAGRIFYDGDAIGVILGQVKATYLRNYLALDPSQIRTGSRSAVQEKDYRIVPGGAVSLAQSDRGDWARISPVAWTGTYGMPIAPPPPVATSAGAPQPNAPPPVPSIDAPVPAPMASAAATVGASPPSDPLQIEQRFATLKRLLDSRLISEADYDRAKADLLKAIAELPH